MKPLVLLTSLVLAATTFGLAAQEDAGHREYMISCAICHGESGKGGGPFAPLLNIDVPNLTQLSANNDGEFPMTKTLMTVDGRSSVRAHGDSAMPIWGDRFTKTVIETGEPFGLELIVAGRLLSLVYYLESIQE